MPGIQQGASGTLVFVPEAAALSPDVVTSTTFQPQGSQQFVKFTPPDRVEGVAAGTGNFKCTVTMGPGEKAIYDFTVDCWVPAPVTPPGPPKTNPVTINYDPVEPARAGESSR